MFEQLAFRYSHVSTSSSAALPAKISQALANKRGCRANARACSLSTSGSSVSCVPPCASSRTCTLASGAPGWTRFGAASMVPATTRELEIFGRLTLGRRTGEVGSSLWPTPTVEGLNNRAGLTKKSGDGLSTAAKAWATPAPRDWKSGAASQATHDRNARPLSEQMGREAPGMLNADWVETLQGFPVGWTHIDGLPAAAKRSATTSRRARSRARKSTGGPA